jgi:dinuclear metal center YbgI/SA1388 family protein
MMRRDELVAALDAYLEIAGVTDYGPNGLQVEGRDEVRSVVTGVTACEALLLEAAARGADMVVAHHGIFWDGQPPILRGALLKRVRALLGAGITLCAYHLPLDGHPEVGNNAPALRDLGATDLEPFGEARGITVGWKGRLREPLPAAALLDRIAEYYACTPLAFLEGPELVRTVGAVSGGAQSYLNLAIAQGLDLFVTGEVSEYNYHLAREEGVHHVSVGHHASERVGPRRLARHLSDNFPVQAEFVDIPNPA